MRKGLYNLQLISKQTIEERATELAQYQVQDTVEELIMYTCYPVDSFGYKTERYVIFAKLVGAENE